MTHRDATPDASHLSTSQFAEREGVSRVRVLQLLAAGRIPGARKIGHHWIVPASAAIVRRAPGRPGRETRAEGRLLRALARPNFVATQVMEMGDYDDALRLEATLGREALARALREAEPGRFSERSWIYWHHRLDLAGRGRIPPLPRRALR